MCKLQFSNKLTVLTLLLLFKKIKHSYSYYHHLSLYSDSRRTCYSLSARILHRAPPVPSGPKFSNSENCCRSENAMQPKFF